MLRMSEQSKLALCVCQDYESSQLSWEQRELELEQQLERLSQQHSEIAVAAAKAGEVSGNIPDPQVTE